MLKYFAAILILSCSFQSHAAINMRNGGYSESWIDFIEPGEGYEMKIQRYYSSRSLFIGLFGFGWCSSLETNLTITSDGIVNLTECGGGLEVTYYPENFDQRSTKQTIEEIMKKVIASQKMTKNDAQNFKTQITSNPKLRFEYANKYGFVDVNKLKTIKNTFHSKSKGVEKIVFDGKFYTRKKYDGTSEKFNKQGKLVQVTNSTGKWIKLNYKGRNLSFIVDNSGGRRINFSYDNNGRLKRIYSNSLEATYKFDNENLVTMNNMWKKTYVYTYDKNHNLTNVVFPDKSEIKLTYDISNDWVTSYSNRLGCREDYSFEVGKSKSLEDPKNHYVGYYKKSCQDKLILSGYHEFWYKNYIFSAKDKYLFRVKEVQDNEYRDMQFHPYLGRPTSIRENKSYQGFAYYLNGLVNKKEQKLYDEGNQIIDWFKSTFKYDLVRFKMSEALKKSYDKKGKLLKKEKTSFKYDRYGNVKSAKTNKGRSVSISYSKSGRVSTLTNHQKVELSLKYRAGINKPTMISQKGLGAVEVTYDNQGEVLSVESKTKRNIASSVIETFLEMIEVLGPMGETIKL